MTAIPHLVNHGPQMDVLMVFGFMVGFLTIVVLLYRHELKTTWPLLGVLLGGMSVYGIMDGSWPLGFVMAALAISELRRWWQSPKPVPGPQKVAPVTAKRPMYGCEARMSRMFGA